MVRSRSMTGRGMFALQPLGSHAGDEQEGPRLRLHWLYRVLSLEQVDAAAVQHVPDAGHSRVHSTEHGAVVEGRQSRVHQNVGVGDFRDTTVWRSATSGSTTAASGNRCYGAFSYVAHPWRGGVNGQGRMSAQSASSTRSTSRTTTVRLTSRRARTRERAMSRKEEPDGSRRL